MSIEATVITSSHATQRALNSGRKDYCTLFQQIRENDVSDLRPNVRLFRLKVLIENRPKPFTSLKLSFVAMFEE